MRKTTKMKVLLAKIQRSSLGRIGWGKIVGTVAALIGIAIAGLALYDRFSPPGVEILDLTPVYIAQPKIVAGARNAIRGVGVLLHVRAASRPISITGLELTGKRCISFDEFYGLVGVEGKSHEEIAAEFERQRPFQQVSFFGWPTERAGPVSLTPWEESFIRFTFLEPGIGTNPGLHIDDQGYFGSKQRSSPMTRRYGFNVREIFTLAPSDKTSWTAGHLRHEILDGVLSFRVMTGGSQISVPTTALRALKRLDPDAWKKEVLPSILAEQYPSIELEPIQSRAINCYVQPKKRASSQDQSYFGMVSRKLTADSAGNAPRVGFSWISTVAE